MRFLRSYALLAGILVLALELAPRQPGRSIAAGLRPQIRMQRVDIGNGQPAMHIQMINQPVEFARASLHELAARPVVTGRKHIPRMLGPSWAVSKQAPSRALDDERLHRQRTLKAGVVSRSFAGTLQSNPPTGIPPDTQFAVGPNHIGVFTNERISFFTKNGQLLRQMTAETFFRPVNPTFIFDPRALFDQHSNRFIVTYLDGSAAPNSRLFFAVSQTTDPTGQWFFFSIDADMDGSTQRNNWLDFQDVGVDQDALYFTGNMFSNGGLFQYVKVWVVPKAQLLTGSSNITWFETSDLTNVFTLRAAHVFGTSPTGEYLVGFRPGLIDVLRITSPLTLGTVARVGTIAIPSSGLPPTGPPNLADPRNDDRLLNAFFQNGSVWTTHTIGVTAGAATKQTARWYELDVIGLALRQSGTVDPNSSRWYYYPSVAVNGQGDMVLSLSGSSSTEFPGTYYTGRTFTDPPGVTDTPILVKAGEAAYDSRPLFGEGRWGDYSGAAVDPVAGGTFWVINEFAQPSNFWGTWVAEVTFSGLLRGTVTNVNASPIAAASVSVTQSGQTTVIGTAMTANDGVYVVPGLNPGIYSARISAAGYQTTTLTGINVAGGAITQANASLTDDGSRISGRVTRLSDGVAIPGASVSASQGTAIVASATTALDGTYSLFGLPASDNYSVLVLAAALGGSTRTAVAVSQGVETPNINFALSPDPGAILGRVIRATNGTGVSGVSIQARQGGVTVGAPVTSDTNGGFVMTGLLSGPYDLTATPSVVTGTQSFGLSPQTQTNIAVNPGQTTANVNFTLATATGTIQGAVTRSTDAAVLQGVTLRLLQNSIVLATTATDAQGRYTFANLTTGTYELSATLTAFVDAVRSNLGVTAGQVITQNLSLMPVTTGTTGGGGPVTATTLLVRSGVTVVTVPSNLNQTGVADFFGTSSLRVARFDPRDERNINGYVVSPPHAFNLTPGEAYFVKAPADVSLSIAGSAVSTTTDFTRTLPNATPTAPIWTLIGNPYLTSITWDLTRIQYSVNGSAPQPLTALLSEANAPVTFYGWKWNPNGNSYVLVCDPALFSSATNVVGAGEGVFVLVKTSGVQLIFPAAVTSTTSLPTRLQRASISHAQRAVAPQWSLELIARAGGAQSRGNFLGAGASGSGGLKLMAPPRPPIAERYVDLRIVGTSAPVKAEFKANATFGDAWSFDVVTDQPDTEVALSWDNLARVPSSYRLTLVDTETGIRRAMRTATAYTFRSAASGITIRRFRVELDSVNSALKLSNLAVTGSSGRYNVSFLLNRTANVTTRIISPSGKVVRTVSAVGARAGLNAILWDGKTEQGTTLPRGVYLVDLTASEDDGAQVRVVRSATLR